MSCLAIIGTAGRKEDGQILTAAHYNRMVSATMKLIARNYSDYSELTLVSGGAAWADHIAVSLALLGLVQPDKVHLFLPAEIDNTGFCKGTNSWEESVANTANYYHRNFSNKIGRSSIDELNHLKNLGASFDVIKGGFKARNGKVAKFVGETGAVLAFTFGTESENDQPEWTIRAFGSTTSAAEAHLKDGGTADTWNRSKCTKYHCRIGIRL